MAACERGQAEGELRRSAAGARRRAPVRAVRRRGIRGPGAFRQTPTGRSRDLQAARCVRPTHGRGDTILADRHRLLRVRRDPARCPVLPAGAPRSDPAGRGDPIRARPGYRGDFSEHGRHRSRTEDADARPLRRAGILDRRSDAAHGRDLRSGRRGPTSSASRPATPTASGRRRCPISSSRPTACSRASDLAVRPTRHLLRVCLRIIMSL